MIENDFSSFYNRLKTHFNEKRDGSEILRFLKEAIKKDCIHTFPLAFQENKGKRNEDFEQIDTLDDFLLTTNLDKDSMTILRQCCLASEYLMTHSDSYYSIYFGVEKNDIIDASSLTENNRRVLYEYLENLTERKVGPFFSIDGHLVSYMENITQYPSEKYFIDSSKNHFDFFNEIKTFEMREEYSMYPRGRVLYDVQRMLFKVYLDKSLYRSKRFKNKIRKDFHLPVLNVIFDTDEHYQVLNY